MPSEIAFLDRAANLRQRFKITEGLDNFRVELPPGLFTKPPHGFVMVECLTEWARASAPFRDKVSSKGLRPYRR
jgi:hypothetical protein